MHLLIPLLASLVFVASLICVKRAARPRPDKPGVNAMTVLFFTNLSMALAFTFFWPLGGHMQPAILLWQPMALAIFFILGLMFTFAAVRRGDISIATPVFGIKIIFVALLLSTFGTQNVSIWIWLATFLASAGIGLVQWTGRHERKNVLTTISFALIASTFYAHFDVLIQGWAPVWGSGRILPLTFWLVGLLSLVMLPWVEWKKLLDPELRFWLAVTCLLSMLQAFLIVLALSFFGDAARINIVFALRGLWAVILAWTLSKRLGGTESELNSRVFRARFAGAGLLTAAVILAIATP